MNKRKFLRATLLLAAFFAAACTVTKVEYYPCPEGMDCSPDPGDPGGMTSPGDNDSTEFSGSGQACESSSDCQKGTCLTKGLLDALGTDTTYIDIPNGMCAVYPCTDEYFRTIRREAGIIRTWFNRFDINLPNNRWVGTINVPNTDIAITRA